MIGLLYGLIAFMILFPIAYFSFVEIAKYIPVNNNYRFYENSDITIYVVSNGKHTDFMLPSKNNVFNWINYLNSNNFKQPHNPQYLSIGWGDKGFFIDTPEWEDLTFKTFANALFWPSPTAMHTTYVYEKPAFNNNVSEIKISINQYELLVNYITDHFQQNKNIPIKINCKSHYGTNDCFFEAHKSYHAFRTCNNWTNIGLKKMGVKTAVWAPLASNVMHHLPKPAKQEERISVV